jgi:hypothetical protein
MKLVITTQVRENYGAHDWDGTGSCPQYWKFKGGSEYIVDDIEHFVAIDDDFFAKNIKSIVYDYISPKITQNSDYYEESIIDYSIEDDDYMSEFEKSQMEYDGKITYFEPRITIDGDIIARDKDSFNNNIVKSSN